MTVDRDDFNLGWNGWQEGEWTISLDEKGEFVDTIKTSYRLVNVNMFLPSPPQKGLPAVFSTPQQLKWWCPLCKAWRLFASIDVKAQLVRDKSGFSFVTTSNGKSVKDVYIGKPLKEMQQ